MPIADNVNYNPSRLLTSTEIVRNQLVARNLYTPNRIYPITEKQQVQNVVNAVSSVLSMIAPFKSIDLKNTVFARLIVQQSPLSDIGLAMLGTQFAYNAGSNMAQQHFPTIKLANLFDGDKNTHLFTENINFSITKKPKVTSFQDFLDSLTSFNPSRKNPFKGSQSTNINSIPISNNPLIQNSFYIKNTGLGQLTFLINAFNQNIYKEGFSRTPTDNALQTTASEINAKLTTRNTLIGSESSPQNKFQNYYNFFTAQSNPYSIFPPISTVSIINANGAMVYAMENINNFAGLGPTYSSAAQAIQGGTQEYAPTQDYVKFNLGTGIKEQGYSISEVSNNWINPADEFNNVEMDSVVSKDKLVWGRNGISAKANEETNILLGTFNDADSASITVDRRNTEFNAYQGLLEYTRNLLNASEGNLISITKKAFLKGKNIEGFNGSALWVANNSTYAQKSETAGLTGVRQHSAFDQYNRFAKAIRFNGNTEYQGNPNSVIYKSVIPRMHPTIDKNLQGQSFLNNHNLMFSIENLAVRVISNDSGIGIIDDEYGSMIPACEVGQFNGRQMWFPPYDVTIQETTNAVYESTVMVGRSEPMYAYQNSTRTATLTFTLLVDYPYQLKDALYQGANKHKIISEFFAFGGNPYGPLTPVNNPPKKSTDIEIQKKTITGPTQPAGPDELTVPDKIIVFPNDFPKPGQEDTAIDVMYGKEYEYQIINGCLNARGQVSSGFNNGIFVKMNVSGDSTLETTNPNYLQLHLPLPAGFSQYTTTAMTNTDLPGGGSALTAALYKTYNNVNNRSYYDIIVRGGASKLYIEDPNTKAKKEPKYNTDLGLRRANAAIKLIRERIKALFGQYPENLNPKINVILDTSTKELTGTVGSTGSLLASLSTAEIKRIEVDETISARYARITIKRNNKVPPPIVPPTSQEDKSNITKLNHDSNSLAKISSNQKSNSGADCVYNERGKDTEAILNGFKSISGNYMYPVFHSQTPEDFHRRLTFLQQCMRQGAAKRFDMTDDNGILRAKNSVFGRQPICILRIGDFFFTKVVINQLNIDYTDAPWDMNPEGFGMQPMLAKITLQMNIIGGQSLVGPIDALQNALTFNYYANSNYTNAGMYYRPATEANNQKSYMDGILTSEQNKLKYALFAPGLKAMGFIPR
jgi:hypothetical protein